MSIIFTWWIKLRIKSILCSIGSLGVHNSQACVANITVRNTVIRHSDNGVRIKTWQGGTGSVTGLTFDTIYMEDVRNCIIIDQYYCLSKKCMNQSTAVYVSDVVYNNIRGTYDVRSPPIHFACSDSMPCANITMSEIELFPFEGELVDDPFCWNAYGMQQTPTIPPITCLQDGEPETIMDKFTFGCWLHHEILKWNSAWLIPITWPVEFLLRQHEITTAQFAEDPVSHYTCNMKLTP